ncbi:hypothetical protein MKW92_007179 [Papaver armeniacum]|nr:hypothetical protein MKW92_007179 [Papaver armeniacum]
MKGCELELPAGFRFHPTDEELVMHYLCRKCASLPISVPIIADIDLYKFDPWLLPGMALYGEKEWYFFSPRDRKYPNGSRPNRAAGTGYWKATGADKPIGKPKPVGIKKALVFYEGKAPKGVKTNWIMHEYRLAGVDRSARKKSGSNSRLDDWVLCRIYNKKGFIEKQGTSNGITDKAMLKSSVYNNNLTESSSEHEDQKPDVLTHYNQNTLHTWGNQTPPAQVVNNDYVYFDTSDSVPRLHTDSSNCSEHVTSTCEREVQSQPRSSSSWSRDFDWGMQFSGNDVTDPYASSGGRQVDNNNIELSPLQDMFMYLQNPY